MSNSDIDVICNEIMSSLETDLGEDKKILAVLEDLFTNIKLENKQIIYVKDLEGWIFSCPHCLGQVFVKVHEINCQIFRHGMYKLDGGQLPPHLPKSECVRLIETNQIEGCAKPFKFNGETVEICDYI
jgi:hypothetical protein